MTARTIKIMLIVGLVFTMVGCGKQDSTAVSDIEDDTSSSAVSDIDIESSDQQKDTAGVSDNPSDKRDEETPLDYSFVYTSEDIGLQTEYFYSDAMTPDSLIKLGLYGCNTVDNAYLYYPGSSPFLIVAGKDCTLLFCDENMDTTAETIMNIPYDKVSDVLNAYELGEWEKYKEIQLERLSRRENWPGTPESDPHNFYNGDRFDYDSFMKSLGYDCFEFPPNGNPVIYYNDRGALFEFHKIGEKAEKPNSLATIQFPTTDGRLAEIDYSHGSHTTSCGEDLNFLYLAYYLSVMQNYDAEEIPAFDPYYTSYYDEWEWYYGYYKSINMGDDGSWESSRLEVSEEVYYPPTLYDDFGSNDNSPHYVVSGGPGSIIVTY